VDVGTQIAYYYNEMDKISALERFIKSEISFFYNLSKVLVEMDTHPERLISEVVRMLSNIEGVKRVAFYIAESNNSEIRLVSSAGVEDKNIKLNKNEGIVGFIFRRGYPVVLKNLAEEPLFLNKIKRTDLNDVSFIGVPIKYEDKVEGVITVDMNKGAVSTVYLLDILVIVSNLIGKYMHTYIKLKEKEEAFREEIITLKSELMKKFKLEGFVGTSKIHYSIVKQILKVSQLDVTVMLRGESGTGKSTIAKIIHYLSPRRHKPFIEVNCSAIPESLFEAELFGYEKGAFTGAYTTKVGKIEAANGGTLFLDEVGDLNLTVQAKLLRFLQTKEFERLGSTKTIKSDVRIIVATNKDLEEMVRKGEFREDLYYRICVYPIYIPPLKERKEDIPVLVEHYIKQISNLVGKKLKIDREALKILLSCDFPGNVRELVNCLTRAAITSDSGIIHPEHFSCISSGMCFSHLVKPNVSLKVDTNKNEEDSNKEGAYEKREIPKDEKQRIIEALESVGYVQAKAARLLGMTVRQLNYRIKKYGIQIKKI